MHSIREMCGSYDVDYKIRLFVEFFRSFEEVDAELHVDKKHANVTEGKHCSYAVGRCSRLGGCGAGKEVKESAMSSAACTRSQICT